MRFWYWFHINYGIYLIPNCIKTQSQLKPFSIPISTKTDIFEFHFGIDYKLFLVSVQSQIVYKINPNKFILFQKLAYSTVGLIQY